MLPPTPLKQAANYTLKRAAKATFLPIFNVIAEGSSGRNRYTFAHTTKRVPKGPERPPIKTSIGAQKDKQ